MRRFLNYFNGILMAFMFLIIFIQIFGREVLHIATPWSVEAGVILFTFIVLYGIPCVTRERMHLRVDVVYNIMTPYMKLLSDLVCGIIYIAFFLYMGWGAYQNAVDNWIVEIPTIEFIHLGWVYCVIALATVLHIVCLCINIREDWRALFGGRAKTC